MRALAQPCQRRNEDFVTALLKLVSDPAPDPAAAKGAVNKHECLWRGLRAGSADEIPATRSRDEAACQTGCLKDKTARNVKLRHIVSPPQITRLSLLLVQYHRI